MLALGLGLEAGDLWLPGDARPSLGQQGGGQSPLEGRDQAKLSGSKGLGSGPEEAEPSAASRLPSVRPGVGTLTPFSAAFESPQSRFWVRGLQDGQS